MILPEFSKTEQLAESLLSANLTYDYEQTPAHYFAQPEQERHSTNCKVVGHQFSREVLGIKLPVDLQIAEAFFGSDTPRSHLRHVNHTESLRLGDWILYGRPSRTHPRLVTPQYDTVGNMVNWHELAINHLGVYLGEHRGQPMILHATPEDGVAITSQRNIQRSRRTAIVYDVLRVRDLG